MLGGRRVGKFGTAGGPVSEVSSSSAILKGPRPNKSTPKSLLPVSYDSEYRDPAYPVFGYVGALGYVQPQVRCWDP